MTDPFESWYAKPIATIVAIASGTAIQIQCLASGLDSEMPIGESGGGACGAPAGPFCDPLFLPVLRAMIFIASADDAAGLVEATFYGPITRSTSARACSHALLSPALSAARARAMACVAVSTFVADTSPSFSSAAAIEPGVG
jgi:hypothetical protein